MRKTFKVQLKPNNKQASKLFLTAAAARYTYNWALEQENSNYAVGKSFIKESDLRKQFTQFKKTPEFPEKFKTVSNEAMKQAIRDAIKAYIRFFKRKAGHPQFKSARKTKPSFYQETNKIQFTETHVQIECLANSKKRNRRRLNWVRLVEHGRIPTDAKYYNPRITYDGLHWWITVAVDFPDDNCEDSARDAWQYKCMSEDERLRRPNGKLKSEFTRGLEWLRGHPNIHENMDDMWFHMLKGSYGEGVVFDVVHICWIELHGTGAVLAPVPCLLYGFVSSLNCVPISPVCCDRI